MICPARGVRCGVPRGFFFPDSLGVEGSPSATSDVVFTVGWSLISHRERRRCMCLCVRYTIGRSKEAKASWIAAAPVVRQQSSDLSVVVFAFAPVSDDLPFDDLCACELAPDGISDARFGPTIFGLQMKSQLAMPATTPERRR